MNEVIIVKVLLINGSPNEFGCTYTALKEVEKALIENDIETEILYIGKKAIQGCTGCATCGKLKKCIFDDKVNYIIERKKEYDGLIIGSPVYYSSPNGSLLAFLDRLFYAIGDMSGKVGAAVVSCRRGGASSSFDMLNKYFTISGMPIVSSNYWNQVHGSKPSDVLQDEEGIQTMRILGKNFAWLLKCIDNAKKIGIEMPIKESKIKTNYIR